MSKIVISLLILSFTKFSSCEERSNRIIGGEVPQDKDKWKFMVPIVTGQVLHCQGSLISSKWIVSVAACVQIISSNPIQITCLGALGARIGTSDLGNDYISNFLRKEKECQKLTMYREIISYVQDPNEVVKIKTFFVHPKYEIAQNQETGAHLGAHDIALLQLENPVTGLEVKMPTKTIYEAKNCMIAGWGSHNKKNEYEPGKIQPLKELNVKALGESGCKEALEASFQIVPSMSKDTQKAVMEYKLCLESSDKKQMSWKDDFGSPVVCDNELQGFMTAPLGDLKPTGQYEIIGVYMKMVCYYDWINTVFQTNGEIPFKLPAKDFSKECIIYPNDPKDPEEHETPVYSSVKTLRFNQLYLLLIFFVLFS